MGRAPGARAGDGELNKGPWTQEEDALLAAFIKSNGEGNWRTLPKRAGLQRCRKSCRLRWMNYLRPDLKRGNFSADEDELIVKLHALLGNRWSMIAGRIPGRTDNEIKNYWNTRLRRKLISTKSGGVLEAIPLSLASPVTAPKPEPGIISTSAPYDLRPAAPCSAPPYYAAAYYDPLFPDYAVDALNADSAVFMDYATTTPSHEAATPSELSSDGTCNFDDPSAWNPALDEDLTQAISVKRELFAFSPKSPLRLMPNIPDVDDVFNIDFGSFTTGLVDSFSDTNLHRLLTLSPMQKSFVPSPWSNCYAGDGIW